jgi:hypothetical protein
LYLITFIFVWFCWYLCLFLKVDLFVCLRLILWLFSFLIRISWEAVFNCLFDSLQ